MAPPKFTIAFDSPTNSYYAGTAVTGKVFLTLDKPTKARGLKVKFLGAAKVSWDETESVRQNDGNTHNETVNYHSEEEYFSNHYYLLGSANGEIEIPSGEHSYPFTTTLPPRLPSSFSGEHGHVKYSVTATVDRPWKSDYEAVGVFNVVTPVDLNYIAVAKEPVKKETSKSFCCWCCRSGPLSLVVNVPYTGIVSGQTFPVTIEVDNASNIDVQSVDCKLKKDIKWMVRMPSYKEKEDSVELVKIASQGIEQGKSKTWTENVVVPQMPHVDLDACSIINITFVLKVVAVVSGMHKNLSSEIPMVLGTVPLQGAEVPVAAPPSVEPVPTESAPLLQPTPFLQPAPIMGQPHPGSVGYQPDVPNVIQPSPVKRQPLPGLLPGAVSVYPPIPTIGFNVAPSPSAPVE